MQQVIVIANQTAVGSHITRRLHEIKGDADTIQVHVVVPVTPRSNRQVDELGRPIHDADGRERAERQLREATESIEKMGANVSGSVGHGDPMRAAAAAITGRGRIDRIVVSTLPVGMSRWVGMDLPHRLERRFGIPVDHVVGKAPDENEPTPVSGPVGILLVEDQPADVALTRQALNQIDIPTELKVATNGADAMAALRTYHTSAIDLVLLDLKMPVLDGHEFLEQAGKEADLDELAVVVLTTSTSDTDREKAHALGAGAYIVKDPDFDVFADSLASVVNEVATGRAK